MARRISPQNPESRNTTDGRRVEQQAENHRRTRKAHLSEIAEDYVEVIAELIDSNGEARAVDIARRLGVTHVTVVKTIARLVREDLVSTKPYRSIFLTDAGRQLAEKARHRHQIVVRFLKSLGVSDAAANADAEGIEHHVSAETLQAFEQYCRRMNHE
ncbi:MAG: manganese-binding transcriptional regulator MntR [Phycisphaerales bacterium]|nr:manganese-binding transcriptional regulator MntR [Phycisphaerales bacterium]